MWTHHLMCVVPPPGHHTMQSKKWNPRCHVSKLKRNQSADSLKKVDKLSRLKAVAIRTAPVYYYAFSVLLFYS